MLRILSPSHTDGPTQMAIDEALLECAATPTIRTYTWEPATLSLGYFQEHADVLASLPPGYADTPCVRRITGGGAIWHGDEITYCLVGRLGHDGLPERTRDCYPLLHGAVNAAIAAARGQALALQDRRVGDKRYRTEPRCFASPASGDLVAPTGGKVLGSAARTRGERILIHGSLKLGSNPWDGEVVAACGLEPEGAREALLTGLQAVFPDLTPAAGQLTAAEEAAADRIRLDRYGTNDWVERREGPRP